MGKLLRSNSMHSILNDSLYTHNLIMNCTTVVFIVSMYSSRDPEYNIKLTNPLKINQLLFQRIVLKILIKLT